MQVLFMVRCNGSEDQGACSLTAPRVLVVPHGERSIKHMPAARRTCRTCAGMLIIKTCVGSCA
eukprot:13645009-Alexandrium_andersonii.AAC.1